MIIGTIPITKEDIPYRFEVELKGELFTFEIYYNTKSDFFTVDLIKNNEVLVYGEKLVYGQPLFSAYTSKKLPKVTITAKDEANEEVRVTYNNFYETIFLYVEDEE